MYMYMYMYTTNTLCSGTVLLWAFIEYLESLDSWIQCQLIKFMRHMTVPRAGVFRSGKRNTERQIKLDRVTFQ